MQTSQNNETSKPVRAELEAGAPDAVKCLSWKGVLASAATAAAAFHVAYAVPALAVVIVLFPLGLLQLSRQPTPRRAFYSGLLVGLAVYPPHLAFFWSIFGPAAIALWLVLAFWLGMFVALTRLAWRRFGAVGAAVLAPFLWTGLEYFRSELYFLKFSWLNAAYAFADFPQWALLNSFGMYGAGFVCAALAGGFVFLRLKGAVLATVGIAAVITAAHAFLTSTKPAAPGERPSVKVAGVQLEVPGEREVLEHLDRLIARHPEAQLLVLSEYTFYEAVPAAIKAWCRKHQRHLLLGATDPVDDSQYFNTAFVIGPDGSEVFRQAKSVPIQFFRDGLRAREQKVWDSPWGKLGICICYDLSYRRVTDRLMRQGAQAIIVPTMDAAGWGRSQHELHTRVAPIRAAEYGVPIFRLASSGISQLVDKHGRTTATSPFPGEGAMIGGEMPLAIGRVPLDAIGAPLAAGITALAIMAQALFSIVAAIQRRKVLT